MIVNVHIGKYEFAVQCGRGTQSVRWLALAAAKRLTGTAHSAGRLRLRENHAAPLPSSSMSVLPGFTTSEHYDSALPMTSKETMKEPPIVRRFKISTATAFAHPGQGSSHRAEEEGKLSLKYMERAFTPKKFPMEKAEKTVSAKAQALSRAYQRQNISKIGNVRNRSSKASRSKGGSPMTRSSTRSSGAHSRKRASRHKGGSDGKGVTGLESPIRTPASAFPPRTSSTMLSRSSSKASTAKTSSTSSSSGTTMAIAAQWWVAPHFEGEGGRLEPRKPAAIPPSAAIRDVFDDGDHVWVSLQYNDAENSERCNDGDIRVTAWFDEAFCKGRHMDRLRDEQKHRRRSDAGCAHTGPRKP